MFFFGAGFNNFYHHEILFFSRIFHDVSLKALCHEDLDDFQSKNC